MKNTLRKSRRSEKMKKEGDKKEKGKKTAKKKSKAKAKKDRNADPTSSAVRKSNHKNPLNILRRKKSKGSAIRRRVENAQLLAELEVEYKQALEQAQQDHHRKILEILDELCRREVEAAVLRTYEVKVEPLRTEILRRRQRAIRRSASKTLKNRRGRKKAQAAKRVSTLQSSSTEPDGWATTEYHPERATPIQERNVPADDEDMNEIQENPSLLKNSKAEDVALGGALSSFVDSEEEEEEDDDGDQHQHHHHHEVEKVPNMENGKRQSSNSVSVIQNETRPVRTSSYQMALETATQEENSASMVKVLSNESTSDKKNVLSERDYTLTSSNERDATTPSISREERFRRAKQNAVANESSASSLHSHPPKERKVNERIPLMENHRSNHPPKEDQSFCSSCIVS